MRLASLHVHPVKSTAIRDVAGADVELAGLVDDRRWMVVDGSGTALTARTDSRLFRITAATRCLDGVDHDLVLQADGMEPLGLARPRGQAQGFVLHKKPVHGIVAPAADGWLRQVLGRDDARLAWCDDPTRRGLDPDHSRAGDHTGFADGFPLLLTTQASLDQLNEWLAATARELGEEPVPLPMTRFRPNLVLDGDLPPFDEDHWTRVRVGEVWFRVVKPCARCVMTTVDPATLDRGKEPLRTLARHRRVGSKTMFGMNLVPDGPGRLQTGDAVEVVHG